METPEGRKARGAITFAPGALGLPVSTIPKKSLLFGSSPAKQSCLCTIVHSVRRSQGWGQGPGCGNAATASNRGALPVSSKAPALPVISRPNSCQGSRPQSQEGDRMMASQDVFVG